MMKLVWLILSVLYAVTGMIAVFNGGFVEAATWTVAFLLAQILARLEDK